MMLIIIVVVVYKVWNIIIMKVGGGGVSIPKFINVILEGVYWRCIHNSMGKFIPDIFNSYLKAILA